MENKWDQFKASKWDQYKANKEKPKQEESFIGKLPRNIITGLANLGHKTVNSPHDLTQGLETSTRAIGRNMQSVLPENLQKMAHPEFNISEHIPTQEEHDYASILGQKGEPTFADTLVQKLVEHSPDLLAGAAAYRELPIALTRRGASRELRQAQHLARERNVGNINIPPQLIEDIRQFLPNTHPYRTLLEQAHLGQYDPLFALQSDLGRASRGYSRSPSFAERRTGREAARSRNELLGHMRHGLGSQGHLDIADLLRAGQRRYRNFSRIRPYRNIAVLGAASQTPYAKKLLHSVLDMF